MLPCRQTHGDKDDEWTEHKEYCYKEFGKGTYKTWPLAQTNCNKQSPPSSLVSIHDLDMNTYIHSKNLLGETQLLSAIYQS